jgi:hypothetical protein
MNRILLSIIILSVTITVYAQSSVRGFKSFEKGEFDKAIETFTKHIGDDSTSCAAYFGLALSYSTDTYASRDYFKAWDYYIKAKKYFDKLNEDERLFFKQFFTDRDSKRRNQPLKYNFEYEEKELDNKLIKYVREENKVELAEHFLAVYPNSKYYENVVHIRNHIKFRLAEKANTLEAYNDFIKQYPEAAQVPKAINASNKLAFEASKKENTIASYTKFMKDYPQADQYFEALKLRDQLAFDDARKQNTIEAMDAFITNYPKALQLMNARTILRKLLYEKAKQVNTLEAYNDFISKYPDGEFYVDIFNLKSSVLGQKIVARIEGARDAVVWAKGFDYDDKNDIAGGIVTSQDGKTFVAGTRQKTDEEGTQTWLISLDNTGRILWNKAFGSKPFNSANLIALTPRNDLLVAGWSGGSQDTLSHKAWIFKAGLNGNGEWEKSVDGNEIKDMALTPDGSIYLCGYQMDDSARIKNFLLKLNPETKKMWSRQYLKKGCLEGITLTPKGELVCASGRWVWKLDNQGYILWERTIPAEDSIMVPRYAGTQLMLCGSKNNTPLLLKMNETGSPAGEITSISAEPTQIIHCLVLPNKRLLTLETPGKTVKFRVIDDKGTELRYLSIPNARVSGPGAITVNQAGEVYLTFTSLNEQDMGDICVVKLHL